MLIAAVASTSNGNKSSLYESLRQGGAASLLESLQSQLKQKEGEINQLQVNHFCLTSFEIFFFSNLNCIVADFLLYHFDSDSLKYFFFFQEDISQLEKTRESMARELVNLSNLNEDLQEQVKELPEIKEKHSVSVTF